MAPPPDGGVSIVSDQTTMSILTAIAIVIHIILSLALVALVVVLLAAALFTAIAGLCLYAARRPRFAPRPALRRWHRSLGIAVLATKLGSFRERIVATHVRNRILAYARSSKARRDFHDAAARLLHQPRNSSVHDDHYHVRITCPKKQKDICVEQAISD